MRISHFSDFSFSFFTIYSVHSHSLSQLQFFQDFSNIFIHANRLFPYFFWCICFTLDQTFVEDEGWHQAAERYEQFIQDHKKQKIVFLELGVGYNTPGIIKYPFWQMANTFPHAFYVCLNQGEAYAPEEITRKSVCMNEDIGEILKEL